jgi:hypothetical protein
VIEFQTSSDASSIYFPTVVEPPKEEVEEKAEEEAEEVRISRMCTHICHSKSYPYILF